VRVLQKRLKIREGLDLVEDAKVTRIDSVLINYPGLAECVVDLSQQSEQLWLFIPFRDDLK
jgi:hypothetical protein